MTVEICTPQRSGHDRMNLYLVITLVVTTWAGFAKSDGCNSCPIDGNHDKCDDVYNPPPRIEIEPGMCDKIGDLPSEQTKLCKKYDKHPGYYVSCSNQGMTFSCKASCGVKVEDVGKNFTINDKLKDIMSNGLLQGLNTPHDKHENLLDGVGFGGDLLSFANKPATPHHDKPNPSTVQANKAGHANTFNQNLVPQGAYNVYQPLVIPNQQNQQPHTNFNFQQLPQPGHSVHNPFPSGPSNFPGTPFFPSNVHHPAPASPVHGPGSPFLPLNPNAGYQQAPQPNANVPKPNPSLPARGPGSPFLPADLNAGYQPAPQANANVPKPNPTPPARGPGSPFLPADLNAGYQPAPQANANVPKPNPTPPARGPGSPFLPADLNVGYQPAPQANANVPKPNPTPPARGPGSPFLPADLNAGYQPAPQANANVPKPNKTPPARGPGSPFLPADLNAGYQPAPQANANVHNPIPTPPPRGPGSPFLPADLNTGYQPASPTNANVPKSISPPPSPTGPTDLKAGFQSASPVPITPTPANADPSAVNPVPPQGVTLPNAESDVNALLSHPAPPAPAAVVLDVFKTHSHTGYLPPVLATKAPIGASKPLPGPNPTDTQSQQSEPVPVNPLNNLPTQVVNNPASSLPKEQNSLPHTIENIPAGIPQSSVPVVPNPSVISALPTNSGSNPAVPQNAVDKPSLLSGPASNGQATYSILPSLPSNTHGGTASGLASSPASGPTSGLLSSTGSGPVSHPVSGPVPGSEFGPLVSTPVDTHNAKGSYTGFTGFAPFPDPSNFNTAKSHPAPQVPTLPALSLPNAPAYNSIHGNVRPQNHPPSAGSQQSGDPFFGFGFDNYGDNSGYQNLGGFNDGNINNNYGSTNNQLGQLTDSLHNQMNDLKDTSASGAKSHGTSSSTNTGKTSSSSNINSYNTGSSNTGSTSGGSSTHDLGAANNAGHDMTNDNDLFTGFGNMFSGQGGSRSGNHGNGFHANPVSHAMFNQLSNHQGYFQGFQPFNNFVAPPKQGNKQQPVSKNNIFSNDLFDFMGRRR